MPSSLGEMIVGTEWLVEAFGCDPGKLRDENLLRGLFSRVMDELGLMAIDSVWHAFGGEAGVTGIVALTESHLACHTYPEYGTATFNLYCCRTRPEWDWVGNLKEVLGAGEVKVARIERGSPASKVSDRSAESEISAANARSEISDLRSQINSVAGTTAGRKAAFDRRSIPVGGDV